MWHTEFDFPYEFSAHRNSEYLQIGISDIFVPLDYWRTYLLQFSEMYIIQFSKAFRVEENFVRVFTIYSPCTWIFNCRVFVSRLKLTDINDNNFHWSFPFRKTKKRTMKINTSSGNLCGVITLVCAHIYIHIPYIMFMYYTENYSGRTKQEMMNKINYYRTLLRFFSSEFFVLTFCF